MWAFASIVNARRVWCAIDLCDLAVPTFIEGTNSRQRSRLSTTVAVLQTTSPWTDGQVETCDTQRWMKWRARGCPTSRHGLESYHSREGEMNRWIHERRCQTVGEYLNVSASVWLFRNCTISPIELSGHIPRLVTIGRMFVTSNPIRFLQENSLNNCCEIRRYEEEVSNCLPWVFFASSLDPCTDRIH
jgi:hypothetical protein